MNFRLLPFALAGLLGLASACGSSSEQIDAGGDRDDGAGVSLAVAIEVGGGFVPPGTDFRQPPPAVVYTDGTVFALGAITLQYPGPAVLPVLTGSVSEAQVEQLLAKAEEAGLTEERSDWGQPPVADASTTKITVVVDGEAKVNSIYALGMGGGPPGPEGDDGGESDEARRLAQEFVDQVTRVATEGAQDQFEPTRYRVLPLDPAMGPQPDAALERQVKDWPFADVELETNQCVALTDDRANRFAEELATANEATLWRTASGEEFPLAVRATLPHEPDCPPAEESQ